MRGARSSRLGDLARRSWPALLGLAAAAGVALYLTRPGAEGPAGPVTITATVAPTPAERLLDCAFHDGASRIPKVGFTFAMTGTPAAYVQIDRRATDGSHGGVGSADAPRPAWTFDGSNDPATLTSPDGSIGITLHADRPEAGTTWFEAGLRSVRYRNLDGQCRTSAA